MERKRHSRITKSKRIDKTTFSGFKTKFLENFYSLLGIDLSIDEDLIHITNIRDFLLYLKSLHADTFSSCHLLTHKKGAVKYYHYILEHEVFLPVTEGAVKEFTTLFNGIKKSKNKQFIADISSKISHKIVGTYLAKELSFDSHNIVLIISNSEFLHPSDIEQAKFEQHAIFVGTHLKQIIKNDENNRQFLLAKDALKSITTPIRIYKDDICIFSNYKEDTKKSDWTEIKIFNNYNLFFLNTIDENLRPEILHSKRSALIEELLNTLQHELSNPLFGIRLAAEALAEDSLVLDEQETLKEMAQSSLRCQKIIENFSFLHKNQETSFVQLDILKTIPEILTLTKSETKRIKKEIVILKQDESIKEVFLFINPTWFTQIIFNLVINASQAIASIESAKKEITITIDALRHKKEVIIHVKDSGPGINDEIKNEIFKPFFTTKRKGTGLGLPICINLANKIGGKISATNNIDGVGATFTLWLPGVGNEKNITS